MADSDTPQGDTPSRPPEPPPPPRFGIEEERPVAPPPLPPAPHRAPAPRSRRANARPFDFGGVFGGTFKTYFRKLPSILLMSLVLMGAPTALGVVTARPTVSLGRTAFGDPAGPRASENPLARQSPAFWGANILRLLLQMVLAGSLTYLIVRDQQRRPVSVGEAIGRGFARLLPMIGCALLVAAVMLAMFVPAVVAGALSGSAWLLVLCVLGVLIPIGMYYCSVYVAIPACAVEGSGPMESIGRSRHLCIGHRWYVFGLLVVMILVIWTFSMAVAVPLATRGSVGALRWVPALLGVFVTTPLAAVLNALVYVELRAVKEGVDPDGIAEVFA